MDMKIINFAKKLLLITHSVVLMIFPEMSESLFNCELQVVLLFVLMLHFGFDCQFHVDSLITTTWKLLADDYC
jgi:hypothetical protein